jgi:ABC-type bacteriocin/lantibiotic exporter with double-glycine peptidase domain
LADEYISARRLHFRVVWRQTVFSLGLQVIASTILLGIGGFLVIDRQLTLGQLVAAELIVALVVASVSKLGKYAESYYDLMAGAEKIGLITDLPMERPDGETLPRVSRGMEIRVHGVERTAHGSLPTPNVWYVRSGERVAIDGLPGSGRTTLFELLCGLREPVNGVIEIDGIDLRGLSLEQMREQVALVDGTGIFIGTVTENIRVGRSHLSTESVREALRHVGLIRAVHDLPNGLNTPLTPDGRPLSASQALRLTIARALVGQPRLLILDGVLDALDMRDCPDLLLRLFERSAPWTLIVATSNPTVIGMCDRIIGRSPEALIDLKATDEQGGSR